VIIRSGQPVTLGQIFANNARHFRDEPALELDGQTRTHSELYQRGCRLASGLAAMGLRKQDRIAIISANNLEFIECYVAGWSAGFVLATVNWRLAVPEWIYILKDVAPRLLIVEAQFAQHIPALREAAPTVEHVIVIGPAAPGAVSFESVIESAESDELPFHARAEDVAALIYTSGTTGRPKGCILGQQEMAYDMQLVCLSQANSSDDRFLCVMPLFHIGGMSIALSVLYLGGMVHVHRQFEPDAVIDALERDRITMILMAPTMVQLVLDRPGMEKRDYSALRMLIYSAAPMPGPVLDRGLKVFGPVFLQMFGSSEGNAMAWLPRGMHRPGGTEQERARLRSVGTAYASVGLRIVDDDGNDLPAGEPGEVVIKSPVLFRGYWNNSVATLEAIRDGWFFSGDVGRMDDQGYLYLIDRKKDMIISGGENIYSREVEEAILTHPAVSEAAVIGRPDLTWGETVCACVVLADGASASEQELIDHTRDQIASYKKPRDVIFVDEIPKLVSGKVDKKVLRDLYGKPAG
jgi:acyl-CoA synthetase (AMP-forming)/AMP-acid ligase II